MTAALTRRLLPARESVVTGDPTTTKPPRILGWSAGMTSFNVTVGPPIGNEGGRREPSDGRQRRRTEVRKIVVSQFVSLDGVIEDPVGIEDLGRGAWTSRFDSGEEAKRSRSPR
jgi:hypothetical protein